MRSYKREMEPVDLLAHHLLGAELGELNTLDEEVAAGLAALEADAWSQEKIKRKEERDE